MQAYPMPGAILLCQNTRSEMHLCPGASSPLFLTHVQCRQLETGHHGSTHRTEIGKCHKAGLLSAERAVNLHQHTLETPPALPQPPRAAPPPHTAVLCLPAPHLEPASFTAPQPLRPRLPSHPLQEARSQLPGPSLMQRPPHNAPSCSCLRCNSPCPGAYLCDCVTRSLSRT